MKILVLSPGIPSAKNSGLGIAAHAISQALTSHVDLTIVQPGNTPPTHREENTLAVEFETAVFSTESIVQNEIELSVSARFDPYHFPGSGTSPNLGSEEFREINIEMERYKRQVLTKTKKAEFDLVYAHDWITFQTALAIKENSGIPFVAHVHSLDYDRGARRYRSFVFDIEKESLTQADAIIAVSEYTRAVLIGQYGIDPGKISVVYNGLTPFDTPEVEKPLPEKIILFAGRLTVQKGPELFIRIAEQLAAKRKDVRFVVVGDGDLFIQLVEQSAKLPDVKIHFTGYCGFNELSAFYAMADVFCMPSISEPFGLTAIEAAWAGVPVVLSDYTGAAEILKGAWLANPEDPATFVSQLETVLNNPDRAGKYTEENKKFLQGLTWGKAAEQIINVFTICLRK